MEQDAQAWRLLFRQCPCFFSVEDICGWDVQGWGVVTPSCSCFQACCLCGGVGLDCCWPCVFTSQFSLAEKSQSLRTFKTGCFLIWSSRETLDSWFVLDHDQLLPKGSEPRTCSHSFVGDAMVQCHLACPPQMESTSMLVLCNIHFARKSGVSIRWFLPTHIHTASRVGVILRQIPAGEMSRTPRYQMNGTCSTNIREMQIKTVVKCHF